MAYSHSAKVLRSKIRETLAKHQSPMLFMHDIAFDTTGEHTAECIEKMAAAGWTVHVQSVGNNGRTPVIYTTFRRVSKPKPKNG